MTERHPTPEAIRTVAGRLSRIEGITIDMSVSRIWEHPCGTTACHGGAYLLICTKELNISPFIYSQTDAATTAPYVRGGGMMARHLGFKRCAELTMWADRNPELWGNIHGMHMFDNAGTPFGVRYPTLHDICEHWLAVAARIEKMNDEKALAKSA